MEETLWSCGTPCITSPCARHHPSTSASWASCPGLAFRIWETHWGEAGCGESEVLLGGMAKKSLEGRGRCWLTPGKYKALPGVGWCWGLKEQGTEGRQGLHTARRNQGVNSSTPEGAGRALGSWKLTGSSVQEWGLWKCLGIPGIRFWCPYYESAMKVLCQSLGWRAAIAMGHARQLLRLPSKPVTKRLSWGSLCTAQAKQE